MHRPAHRALPGIGPRFRRAVVRATCLTVGLGVVVLGGAGMALQDHLPSRDFDVEVAPTSPLGKLMDRFECSTLGFGDGSDPRSAIVRRANGHLAVVSFDEGWQVHVDQGAAQLVAVCLRPPR